MGISSRSIGFDPADQAILRDKHPLADVQRGEAFTAHECISVGTGDAEYGGNLSGIQGQGKLIERCDGVGSSHSDSFVFYNFMFPSYNSYLLSPLKESDGSDSLFEEDLFLIHFSSFI
jgi:hypothetical protein